MHNLLLGMILVCCCGCVFAAEKAVAGHTEAAAVWRQIPIPAREHGYGQFGNKIICSSTELEAFLQTCTAKQHWNKPGLFIKAVRAAAIDFETEELVLISHLEGSGSNKVTFLPPRFQQSTLTCTITTWKPDEGTADMAYYCFALVVKRAQVHTIAIDKARITHSSTINLKQGTQKQP